MNTENYLKFRALHHNEAPLLLVNIWDAAGASIVSNSGAKAVATSSASMAWSLGYADGYRLPQNELLSAVERIIKVTELPVTIDIENGYSDNPVQVAELCTRLSELGVVGINLEDGQQPEQLFCEKISAIKMASETLFVNARTDLFLAPSESTNNTTLEAIHRAALYRNAGADCLFIPGLSNFELVRNIVEQVQLPLNLMLQQKDDIEQACKAGIARISLGPASFLSAYSGLMEYYQDDKEQNQKLQYDTMQGYLL